jgi:hypothetical protein
MAGKAGIQTQERANRFAINHIKYLHIAESKEHVNDIIHNEE